MTTDNQWLENLKTKRAEVSEKLMAGSGPPAIRWDEYVSALLDHMDKMTEQIMLGEDLALSSAIPFCRVSQAAT